jgi:hypothetical protein
MKKVLLVVATLLLASSLSAQAPDRYAVVVASPEYSTDILVVNGNATASPEITIKVDEAFCSWSYKKQVPGAILIDDAAGLLCEDGFSVVKISTSNPLIEATSLVTYDGSTKNAFSVPSLGLAMQGGATSTIRGVQSTADRRAFISLWNLGDQNANLTIRVSSGAGAQIGTETLVLSPGFNYYMINTVFDVGTLVLSQELAGWGFPTNEPLVGFVANNIDLNGAPRVIPIN